MNFELRKLAGTKFVALQVKQPPNKELLSAVKRVPCDLSLEQVFESVVEPMLRSKEKPFGDLIWVKVMMSIRGEMDVTYLLTFRQFQVGPPELAPGYPGPPLGIPDRRWRRRHVAA